MKINEKKLMHELFDLVVSAMRRGEPTRVIRKRLLDAEIKEEEVDKLIAFIYQEIRTKLEKEQVTKNSLWLASLGAFFAAISGGILWGITSEKLEYESPLLPFIMGFLSGFLAVQVSFGKKGLPIQIIAAWGSILSILFGKYIFFVLVAEGNLSFSRLFSAEILTSFLANFSLVISWYDLIWFPLAIVIAYILPRPSKLKLAQM